MSDANTRDFDEAPDMMDNRNLERCAKDGKLRFSIRPEEDYAIAAITGTGTTALTGVTPLTNKPFEARNICIVNKESAVTYYEFFDAASAAAAIASTRVLMVAVAATSSKEIVGLRGIEFSAGLFVKASAYTSGSFVSVAGDNVLYAPRGA